MLTIPVHTVSSTMFDEWESEDKDKRRTKSRKVTKAKLNQAKQKQKPRRKSKTFKDLVRQEHDSEEEASNQPTKKRKSLTVKLPLRRKVPRAPPQTNKGLETSSGSEDEGEIPEPADPTIIKWEKAEVNIDPRAKAGNHCHVWYPRLNMKGVSPKDASILDHFMLFLPKRFVKENLIPAINAEGRFLLGDSWRDIDFEVFITYMALIISMETQQLPDRHLYWSTVESGPFPAYNYGRYMSKNQFNAITRAFTCNYEYDGPLPISQKEETLQKTLLFIEACNASFQAALVPGAFLTLDESMINGYHAELPVAK